MKASPDGTMRIKPTAIENAGGPLRNERFYIVLMHEMAHLVDFRVTLNVGADPLTYSVLGHDIDELSQSPDYDFETLSQLRTQSGASSSPRGGLQYHMATENEKGRYNWGELVADAIANWFMDTFTPNEIGEHRAEQIEELVRRVLDGGFARA